MKLSSNFSKGKLNKDVDERLVPKGEYTDALNIRVLNSEGSDVGAVENEKGNTKLTFNSESDNPMCIGSVSDEANEKIYWFVVNDSGHSFIYEYDVIKKLSAVVLADTRSGDNQVLNFNKLNKITGIDVIYNIVSNKNLLLFTDGINPPRSVSIERAKGYGTNNFDEDDINLYKKPPRNAPIVSPYNTPKVDENSVKERFFSFAYRYKYLDGEYSALSAFSNYQFIPGNFDLDFSTMENKAMVNVFNAYRIKYNTGDKRVTDIQICFKNPKEGIVYVIDNINKKENYFVDNVEKTISFSNKKIYRALPKDEINRIFDDVPLTAKAQEFIENRLVFGNITSQYDLLENETDTNVIRIDYKAEKVSSPQEGTEGTTSIDATERKLTLDFTNKSLSKGSYLLIGADLASDEAGSSPSTYFNGTFTGNNAIQLSKTYSSASELASSDDFVELLTYLTGNFVQNVSSTPPPNNSTTSYGEFSVSSSTSTSIVLLAPSIIYVNSSSTTFIENFEFQSESLYTLRPSTNNLSLKSNRSYEFGLVYLDKYGRYSTIIPTTSTVGNDSSEIFIPVENAIDINSAKITVKNKAPYWADRFKFFIKTNRNLHYNIYSTFYYEDGLYRWILLSGNNIGKVEEGTNLIVKSDDDGPLNREVKVKVLEVSHKTKLDEEVSRFTGDDADEGWIEGNKDAFDNPIKERPGVYMKIKPVGFNMDFNPYNYAEYEGSDRIPWGLFSSANQGFANVTIPTKEEFGLAQYKDGANYVNLNITKGSIINIKFEAWERQDAEGDDSKYYEKEFIVSGDYTGDATTSGFEKFLIEETAWEKPVGQSFYTDKDEQFELTFSKTGSGTATRHLVNVKTVEYTRQTETGFLEAKINLMLVEGITIFETDPEDLDSDVYYETEQTFDIVNGFHVGNTQTQTSSLPGICDLTIGNCFSFGNGVESIQIRDERLSPFFDLDYRPNLALLDGYKRVYLKNTLIYSQKYNAETSYNSLNEFNSSRGIKKTLDSKFGSIQKLFSRETDLIVFQEDRVSKVLFGKALLYNTSGQASLQKIEDVLGQDVPFSGEYGISQNPESFSYYAGRMYFADSSRGVVLRLSQDGITPISYFGLKSYFKNNLFEYKNSFNIGGFDPKHHQYVLSMNQSPFGVVNDQFECDSILSRNFTAASETYTYELNAESAGNVTVAYVAGGTFNAVVTINGVTTSNNSLTGSGNFTVAFSDSDIAANRKATVVLTSVSVGNVQLTHSCPVVDTRKVTIIVVNDPAEENESIINRYKVGSRSYYFDEDVFNSSGVTRNESFTEAKGSEYVPSNGETITMSSLKQKGYHSGDFNVCNRLGYLVSSSSNLTVDNIIAAATFPAVTKTDLADSEDNSITFTFTESSSTDNLYLVFDYIDVLPTVVNDTVTGLANNASTTINVLSNDTVSGTHTVSIHSYPSYGSVIVNVDKTITYDHNGSATTFDSFQYKVTKEGACSAIATVEIGILASGGGSGSTGPYPVTLEYGSVSCAVVCSNYPGGQSGTFYVDVGSAQSGGVFAISSKIYTDAAGNNPAPAYFYTDGTDCRPVSGQGDLGVTTGCS